MNGRIEKYPASLEQVADSRLYSRKAVRGLFSVTDTMIQNFEDAGALKRVDAKLTGRTIMYAGTELRRLSGVLSPDSAEEACQ